MNMIMKKQIFILMACILFVGFFAGGGVTAASPSDYQISGLFEGGEGFLTDVYFLILDTFGVCNIKEDGTTYSASEISSTKASERCVGYGLRGGNLLFYIIMPILLAYLMFWGILQKVKLFDKNTHKSMSIVLALFMAPLGIYRVLFVSMMSLLTGTTVFLLYIFLFILMLGWGYRNMYATGQEHFTMGQMHIEHLKQSHDMSKNIDAKIDEVRTEITQKKEKQENLFLKKDGDFIKKGSQLDTNIKKSASYQKFAVEINDLENRLTLMIAHRDKHLNDAQNTLKEVIS
ncbi:MAG: hypothetical protein GQ477_04420 [Nanohaloarchaea archaeon]|nr:hypothetical protein [Candidatus Nanohaloarchaea archaeon]